MDDNTRSNGHKPANVDKAEEIPQGRTFPLIEARTIEIGLPDCVVCGKKLNRELALAIFEPVPEGGVRIWKWAHVFHRNFEIVRIYRAAH